MKLKRNGRISSHENMKGNVIERMLNAAYSQNMKKKEEKI